MVATHHHSASKTNLSYIYKNGLLIRFKNRLILLALIKLGETSFRLQMSIISNMERQHLIFSGFRESFHLFATTMLSLLLPLSFLLIARLSNVYYLLALNFYTSPQSSSYIFSLFLDTNPILLHALVSVVTMATFVHGLTGSMFLLGKPDHVSILRPRLYVAWIFLCTLQVCVGLGVEGSIAAGIDGINIKDGRISLVSRVVFFLGLHETMIQWCRMIVKPVVDDTVFGGAREEEERVAEKAAVAASCGALWWWKLRDEVESMVTVAEVKKEMGLDMRVADLAGWWLYYVTVSIGVVKIVKGMVRLVGMILRQERSHPHPGTAPANPICDLVDKV